MILSGQVHLYDAIPRMYKNTTKSNVKILYICSNGRMYEIILYTPRFTEKKCMSKINSTMFDFRVFSDKPSPMCH